jgi:hypothetical protein
MATKIYESGQVELLNGVIVEAVPLKIKYLRELMDAFELVKNSDGDDEAMTNLALCASITLKQYCPEFYPEAEDICNMPIVYKLLNYAAGIKVNKDSDESIKKQAVDSGSSWEELDLAKIESEVFLLGIWKDYLELEKSMSMPEILATLSVKRELDHNEKKFIAAMQGVDLDAGSGSQKEWEDMKARVFSKGQATDGNDILAYQGATASKAGFGVGMGIDYEVVEG